MRRKKGWTQAQLAEAARTKPTQIGRVEDPSYGSHTVKTLRGIASALDVAIMIRFVPYSELLAWDTGPRILAPEPFWRELSDAKREAENPMPKNVFDFIRPHSVVTPTTGRKQRHARTTGQMYLIAEPYGASETETEVTRARYATR